MVVCLQVEHLLSHDRTASVAKRDALLRDNMALWPSMQWIGERAVVAIEMYVFDLS